MVLCCCQAYRSDLYNTYLRIAPCFFSAPGVPKNRSKLYLRCFAGESALFAFKVLRSSPNEDNCVLVSPEVSFSSEMSLWRIFSLGLFSLSLRNRVDVQADADILFRGLSRREYWQQSGASSIPIGCSISLDSILPNISAHRLPRPIGGFSWAWKRYRYHGGRRLKSDECARVLAILHATML